MEPRLATLDPIISIHGSCGGTASGVTRTYYTFRSSTRKASQSAKCRKSGTKLNKEAMQLNESSRSSVLLCDGLFHKIPVTTLLNYLHLAFLQQKLYNQ